MQTDADPFDLQRFVAAQAPLYDAVCAELRAGRKRSHWMWFIFPQLEGLGRSAMAQKYAIGSLDEAQAYAAHPLLGRRLRECSAIVSALEGVSVAELFGHTDKLKFRSSMTLFARVVPGEPVFRACLDKYFGGAPDPLTQRLVQLLEALEPPGAVP